MNNSVYTRTINSITATDSFKQKMIRLFENPVENKKTNSHVWEGITAAAVSLAFILTIIAALFYQQISNIGNTNNINELPMLTINENLGDYGFEGYMAYDINELKSGNPWTENDELKTLPVFKNQSKYSGKGYWTGGLSEKQMIQKVKKTASVMGLNIDKIENIYSKINAEDFYENYVPHLEGIIATCGDITIEARINGYTIISFQNEISLPDEYVFTFNDITEKQATKTMNYLLDKYKHLTNFKLPALTLLGDYTIDEKRLFSYSAYDNSGTLIERMLNYNFSQVYFNANAYDEESEGKLQSIWLLSNDILEKLGDYPIITAQKARSLLLQKKYITSVPEELPDEKHIAKVELMYRNDGFDEIYMPYYRFYIELSTMQQDNGLKTYGAFYVPAVDEKYIANMPLWDGSIN